MNEAPAASTPRRRRWFRKRGIDLADLAVNSFAAFLGVFLALMVQNWTSAHDKVQRIIQARQAISRELHLNKATVEKLIQYYDEYEQHAQADTSGISTLNNGCERIEGWNGFEIPVLLRAAYDTSLATGLIGQMDFGDSQLVATVYASQATDLEYLQRNLDWYAQFGTKEKSSCASVFRNSLAVLKTLVKTYDGYFAVAQPTTDKVTP